MEMFEMVDSLTNNLLVLPSVSVKSMDSDDLSRPKTIRKLDQNRVEMLLSQFKIKTQEVKSLVTTKFKELKASLKIQQQTIEATLKKNLQHIEN